MASKRDYEIVNYAHTHSTKSTMRKFKITKDALYQARYRVNKSKEITPPAGSVSYKVEVWGAGGSGGTGMELKKSIKQVLHEYNDDSQHRIVVIYSDGTSDQGQWVEHRQVAVGADGLYGISAVLGQVLPAGVWRVAKADHVTL